MLLPPYAIYIYNEWINEREYIEFGSIWTDITIGGLYCNYSTYAVTVTRLDFATKYYLHS